MQGNLNGDVKRVKRMLKQVLRFSKVSKTTILTQWRKDVKAFKGISIDGFADQKEYVRVVTIYAKKELLAEADAWKNILPNPKKGVHDD